MICTRAEVRARPVEVLASNLLPSTPLNPSPTGFGARRFLDALNFAALRHSNQRRKGRAGAPYVNHLIEVAHILANHGVEDMDVLCAALLHDAIEDAGVTAAEIRSRFGERVMQLVLAVTDNDSEPLWQRKLHQIERAPTLCPEAQNLRIADKISNLRGILTSPPENWSIERKLAYFTWADKVVEGCSDGLLSLQESFFEVHQSGSLTLEVQAAAIRGSFRPR